MKKFLQYAVNKDNFLLVKNILRLGKKQKMFRLEVLKKYPSTRIVLF